jgi:hypothetical protein
LEFRVIWEIEIHAASPEEAAHEARAVQLRPDISATVFGVWEHATQRMHRIDVERHAGRLEPPGDCDKGERLLQSVAYTVEGDAGKR